MNRPPDWLLALLLVAGIYLWQRTVFPLWMIDILPFHVAAYQWKHGDTDWIYTTTDSLDLWLTHTRPLCEKVGGEGFGNPFYYSPLTAAMLSPFAELPARWWRNALFLVNVMLIFVFTRAILKTCGVDNSPRNFLWALTVPLLAFPLSRATMLGQVVPLLAALTWEAVFSLQRGKQLASGVLLGVVSAIKLFPAGLLFIPFVAGKKRVWLTALGVIAAFYALSIAVTGMELHRSWWAAIDEFSTRFYTFQGNQSLIGWYSRVFRDHSLVECITRTDSGLVLMYRAIALLVGGITVSAVWLNRKKLNSITLPAFIGLLMAGILLSMANSWEHYWLWLLPVIGWAIHEEWTNNDSRFRLFWILITAFFFLMKLTRFYQSSDLGRIISGSQTFGMLMLWLWLLFRLRRFSQSPSKESEFS